MAVAVLLVNGILAARPRICLARRSARRRWKRSHPNSITFDDGEDACPVVTTGERRNGKGVIAQGIGPLNPNQHDTTRSGKTITECQLAEVSVACNGYSLLDLSSPQNGMIGFARLIFLDPPNIMPQLAQAADDGPGDVLVGEKTHLQPKRP